MTWTRRAGSRLAAIARVYPLGTVAVVLQAVAATVAIGLLILGQGQKIPLVSDDRFEIQAAFTDAGGLKESKQPPVTVAGIVMGRVTEVRYDRGRALATLELKPEARERVFADATALITPRSALNDLTLDVDPGTPGREPLQDGDLIAQSRSTPPENLDRVTEILDLDTRAHLQVLVDQLGLGVRGRSSSLEAAVRELGPTIDATGRVAAAMADRRRLLTELVGDLEVVFGTLGRRGNQLRAILTDGERTLGTINRRQGEMSAAIRQLAPALAGVEGAMTALGGLSRPLSPALERLRPFADELPGALRSLREFAPSGRGLARDLRALADDGRRPVRSLRKLLRELGPASRSLQPSIERLEPITRTYDRNKLGIGEFGSNFSGIFSHQDANGPTLRALGFFEPIRPENFGLPAGTSGARRAKLNLDVAAALERVCREENVVACLGRHLVPGLPKKLITDRNGKRR